MNSPNVNAIGHEIIYPNGTIGAGLYIHSVDLQNVALFGGAGSATNGQNRILRNRPAGSTASEVFRVDQQNVDDDQPTFVAIQAASTYPAIVSSGNLIVTGDLGIGTSTPGTKVEISTAATNLGTLTVASDYMGAGAFGMISAFKRKGASGVTVNDEAGIVFEHKDTNGSRQEYASIFGGVENTTIGSESGYITFETTLSGTTRGERIRITADGDIGIGTTAPEEKVVGYTFQVSKGTERKMEDIAKLCMKVADKEVPIVWKDYRPGEKGQRECFDNSFAKNQIGYTPQVGLEEGLTRIYGNIKSGLEKAYS